MVSSISSNANRVSGLASGLDTETLVKQLTQGTQSKITSATQQKQLLEWTMDGYHEVTTKLLDFQNKYFGSAFNSLTINDSLKQLSAVSSDSTYVKAIPGANATPVDIYISDIVSLASAAKLQSSSAVTTLPSMTVDTSKLSQLSGKSFQVTLDGKTKTLTFAEGTYGSSQSVKDALQGMLDSSFGSGRISVSLSGDTMSLDSAGSTLSIANTGNAGSEVSDVIAFTDGASNRLNLNAAVSASGLSGNVSGDLKFTINGVPFNFTGDTALSSIISAVNKSSAGVNLSYSNVSDSFTFTSTETGAMSAISVSDTSGTFMNSILSGSGKFSGGTDAVVKLSTNGSTNDADLITITRSSNTFDVGGTSVTLLSKAPGDAKETTSIKIATSTDAIVDKVKQFVSDYNDLLSFLNGKLSETKYSDYLPLTDDQKSELSEKQVEQWTDKAKSGLLRNDSTLNSIVSSIRSSLYAEVKQVGTQNGIGFMLADMGITTGSYQEKGKLHINEDQLRKAVSENPSQVMSLLTQNASNNYSAYATSEQKKTRYNESGLLWRISDIVKNTINKTGIKGTLIELAGSPEDGYKGTSSYSKRISNLSETITQLNDRLTMEQDRYWSQFTAMEKALSQLNSQSDWMTQQFSSLGN